MARSRLAGLTWVMSRPSSSIWPLLTSSSPAISRSRVDLPQPDGPTKTTNSRSRISRSMPLMISLPSKPFFRLWIFRSAMFESSVVLLGSVLFHGAERQAADQLFLADPAENQDGGAGEGGDGRELGPEQPLGTGVGGDQRRQRRGTGGGEVERPERLVPAQDQRQQHEIGRASWRERGWHEGG